MEVAYLTLSPEFFSPNWSFLQAQNWGPGVLERSWTPLSK